MEHSEDFDVVIAGGGPVGLCLAHELGLHGVTTLVVESTGEAGEPRSMGLHPRTLAMVDRRGLLDEFREAQAGEPELTNFRGGFAGIFVLGRAASAQEQPYGLGVSRDIVREVYARNALKLGADIRYHSEFVDFQDSGDAVMVRVRGPEGVYDVGAKYLVGCDGASSRVRRAAGIAFSGTDASAVARLGEVDPETAEPITPGWRRTATGWIVGLPFGRAMTLEWDVPDDLGTPMTAEEMRRSGERVTGSVIAVRDQGFVARFTDSARQADEYRRGRVFLAGDAAHIHLPVGGQGVNLGIQDAMNLGWKLASACRGTAPPDLLDTYHQERHPIGAAVVHNTRAQSALMRPGPQVDALRALFTELLTDFDAVNDLISARITGEGVRYPRTEADHPEIGTFARDRRLSTAQGPTHLTELLHAATGILLEYRRAPLLADLVAPWAGRVRHVRAEADSDLPRCMLLRPDGHVAWAADGELTSADIHGLRSVLETWFGAPSIPTGGQLCRE